MFAKDKNKYPDGTAGILLLCVTVQKAEGERDKDSVTTCLEGDVTWTINTETGLK